MRLVNRAEFLSAPAGVLFSKHMNHCFDDLMIKGGTVGESDFYYQPLSGSFDYEDTGDFLNTLTVAKGTGASIAMDFECESRDGLFDQDQFFAVLERRDCVALMARLSAAMLEGYDWQ